MRAQDRDIEQLEFRRLLSASVVDGVLVVTGTPTGDRIQIHEEFDDATTAYVVYIDQPLAQRPAEQYTIPAAGVRGILVRAGAGDDYVDLYNAPTRPYTRPVTAPSFIDAGIGDDIVRGGKGRDFAFGGFGADRVYGHDGDDWIDGGWGDDRLSGGPDDDYVSGGRGNDTVEGDDGDDRLFGGPGNDHVGFLARGGPINSEPGDDFLSGGSGEDWMVGGSGADRIYGGTDRDHWSLEDAPAEMLDRTPDEPLDVPVSV